MKFTETSLRQHLATHHLYPIYWVHGEDPFLVQEAYDAILSQAQAQHFHIVLRADSNNFKAERFQEERHALGLFSQKKLFLLDFGDKLPQEIIKLVAADLNFDSVVILIKSRRLTANEQKLAAIKAIEQVGAFVALYKVAPKDYAAWLKQKAQSYGIQLNHDTLSLLAHETESNLFAAKQVFEKLALINTKTPDLQLLRTLLNQDARFGVFDLGDALLTANRLRALRIVSFLEQEGTELPLILGVLLKDLRHLVALMNTKSSLAEACRKLGVWDKKAQMLQYALKRLHSAKIQQLFSQALTIDKAAKGVLKDNPWQLLRQWVAHYVS